MKKQILMMFAGASMLILQGCAHGAADRALEKKISAEPVQTRQQLTAETDNLIENAPGLTDEQRSQLISLREKTRAEIRTTEEESLKLRSLLYKDLVATNFNRKEVDTLKSKIKSTEKKRVSLMLDAVEKANTILGHQMADNEQRLNTFYNTDLLHGVHGE